MLSKGKCLKLKVLEKGQTKDKQGSDSTQEALNQEEAALAEITRNHMESIGKALNQKKGTEENE